MRRVGDLIEKIADTNNLSMASWRAARGKRHSPAVRKFQADLDTNLLLLRQQLLTGQVQAGPYYYFTIYEPKKRLIAASTFTQQVLHHAIMQVCHPFFERVQIYHSYASRPGKGTHAAIAMAKINTRRYKWFLKIDVQKFFESIHHEVLFTQLSRIFKEPRLLAVFRTLINSYAVQPHRGLPIGNLTSQYFANHFLSGLDHYILEQITPGGYVRYMDDMVLWDNDKQKLKKATTAINNYVEQVLKAALKPIQLQYCTKGLSFLGFRIFGHCLLLTQRSRQRFIKKTTLLKKLYDEGLLSEAVCNKSITALLAFIANTDTLALKKSIFSTAKGSTTEGR